MRCCDCSEPMPQPGRTGIATCTPFSASLVRPPSPWLSLTHGHFPRDAAGCAVPDLSKQAWRRPPGTDINWVAVTELEDPQRFLNGGELVLTTGMRLRSAPEQRRFVRQVQRAGAVGIGFGTGLTHDDVPPALIAEANRWGLPVVQVPYETPVHRHRKTGGGRPVRGPRRQAGAADRRATRSWPGRS